MWTPLPSALKGLLVPPFIDLGLMAAQQDLGNGPALVVGGPGVIRWGYQSILETVAQGRGLIS